MENQLSGGFCKHFEEASEINKKRRIYYSEKTKGKSKCVSNIMTGFEKFLYPVAYYFDKRAVKYNNQGIPIIKNDFISLKNIKPENTEPEYFEIITNKELKKLAKTLFKLRRNLRRLLKNFDFERVCKEIAKTIIMISKTEKKCNSHLAVIKHILESVGFASQNALDYTSNDDVKLKKFAAFFIKTQMLGTILSPLIDRKANKIHKLKVGIIVNDIPAIPFDLQKWIS